MFTWLIVWDIEGNYEVMGPYNSSLQAQKVADKMDVAGYEIEKLPAMNSKKAKGMVRSYLFTKNPKKFGELKSFRNEHEKKTS